MNAIVISRECVKARFEDKPELVTGYAVFGLELSVRAL
jgi:hypothetical protein